MFRRLLYLILAIFSLNTLAASNTKMSQLVNYVQKKYADKVQQYPVIIFDKDEINWRIARKRAFGENKRSERVELIQQYVLEKTGVEITSNDAINYDTYISILKNSAVAVPLTEGYFSNLKYKICAVFHADPNSNKRLETERVLAFGTKEAYGNLKYEHLKEGLSFEELKKFSLYHELGHCLDSKYLPSAIQDHEDSHGVHQSESFAEVTGLFLLAREGITGVGQTRAKMRTIYSRKMGEFFAKNPQNSFGNPHYLYGGVIYHLAPVLTKGEDLLLQNPASVLDGSVEQLLEVAQELVEKESLPSRAFHAIYTYYDQGAESTFQTYRNYEESMPELFAGVLDSLNAYINGSDEVLTTIFDHNQPVSPYRPGLIDFDIQYFCPSLISGDQSTFEILLENYRSNLEQELGTPSEQRERQKELMNIHETAASSCQ